MRLLVRAVDEKLGLEALADEAALHVDHGDDHGVDRAGRDGLLQVSEDRLPGMPPRHEARRHGLRFSMNTLNGSGA